MALTGGDGAASPDATRLVGLLEGLGAGVVLLEPVFDEAGAIHDAAVVWTTSRARSVWGETRGALASEVRPHFDEWLVAANAAWHDGVARPRLGSGGFAANVPRAEVTIRRLGDQLCEFTVDHPVEHDLLARLEAQNRLFLNLLDLLPVVVIASRTDAAEAEYVSPNVEALLGRSAQEMRDFKAWFEVIPADDTEIAMNIRRLMFSTGEFTTKGRLLHVNGEYRHAEMRMVTRRNEFDGVVRFLITLVDITESERMREQLENSNRFASLSRTAGAFGHEFSSLLQIIMGNLDRIDPDADGVNRQSLDAARDAAGRASTLLSGLVAFAGARPGKLEPVSIPTLCEASHPLFLERLPVSVGMAIDLAPDLPEVVIPPEAMRQIMFQLVDNAAEAMPNGGTIGITVREQPHAACHLNDDVHPGSWVSIAVSDHGKGIDAPSLGYVWEPFFTTRTGLARRGAGLGLSIVHGAVHQAGGHVNIASRPGAGTTVTLYLPGVRR